MRRPGIIIWILQGYPIALVPDGATSPQLKAGKDTVRGDLLSAVSSTGLRFSGWRVGDAAAGQEFLFEMSTVVMRVDLECEKCYKKIRKVLCKVQDKVSIRTITYDEKSNTVTVSGPFDGEEVADRLTSDAGKVITDIHVVGGGGGGGGGGKQKHATAAANTKAPKPGKANGHRHGHAQGQGHGGHGGGGHGGHGGGGHGGHGGGGGGKPEKKHVKFDDDDDDLDDDFDFDFDMGKGKPAGGGGHAHHGHGQGGGGKPKIVTTNTPIAARLEAPRTGPPMSMAAAAPVRMPPMPGMMMAPMPQQQQQPQAMAVPSIWPPPAPEWGYSTQPYGSYGGPPAGGYYGAPAAYGHAGYAPYGYGRNPYGGQQQFYEEEPSAGCSVM
ncbi:hypothetical protein BAE44_0004162 [Dichanthelium oligosanthes]|uniref:HMA domain-containing protein n=1 Tax=Dichanthelium oligosanthes TaxID=888268 RepID=A0A1E5WBL9_9POAL|nr:hypothetical protein BAE44_0004162 [Dichanthelium oligosanthes]